MLIRTPMTAYDPVGHRRLAQNSLPCILLAGDASGRGSGMACKIPELSLSSLLSLISHHHRIREDRAIGIVNPIVLRRTSNRANR
jgi:hypothetical protein